MGGFGSTRWRGHLKAERVENCLAIDVGRIGVGGMLTWTNLRGGLLASVRYELAAENPWDPSIRLRYTSQTGGAVDLLIPLVTTAQFFGGFRRWFVCPRCRRRVRKLYCPTGAMRFGCRACLGLTYRSAQECHRTDLLPRERKALRKMLTEPERISH